MKTTFRIFNLLIASFLIVSVFMAPTVSPVRAADDGTTPEKVTLPGTFQSELGCSADWMPDCDKTALTYDAEDDVWQGSFEVTPNNDQDKKGSRYKAAINGTWDVNYGQKGTAGGQIFLSL